MGGLIVASRPLQVPGERPLHFDTKHPSRIGLLPRTPAAATAAGLASMDDVAWFDLPEPCAIFHTVAAWEFDGADPTAVRTQRPAR